ncbi:MAG: AAA family ATPase [Planctomycetes bacterium]|nr:AAA family ATPase [Planctomycetota bacterium]
MDAVPERAPVWAVEGLIETHDFALLAGEEITAGKSWLVLDLAIARVLGAEWLGFRVASCRPARVLVISSEGGAALVKRRIARLCAGRGVDPAKVEPYIVVIDGRVPLVPRAEREQAHQAAMLRLARQHVQSYRDDDRRRIEDAKDAVASLAVGAVAPNIERLAAIQDAPAGTWGLIVVDTVRKNMVGDENSSADAGRFTSAADELAREHCPVVAVHHTGKGTDGARKRSARGSSELTAGPRAVLSVDTACTPRTMHFELNNHPAPEPVGFELVDTPNGGLKIERREPGATTSGAQRVEDAEVEAALQGAPEPMTLSRIRAAISQARGAKLGSKANQRSTEAAIKRCIQRGAVSEAPIETRSGALVGYRLGRDSSPGRGVVQPHPGEPLDSYITRSKQ